MEDYETGAQVTYVWKVSAEQKGRIVKKLKNGLYQIEHIPSGEIETIPKRAIKKYCRQLTIKQAGGLCLIKNGLKTRMS